MGPSSEGQVPEVPGLVPDDSRLGAYYWIGMPKSGRDVKDFDAWGCAP